MKHKFCIFFLFFLPAQKKQILSRNINTNFYRELKKVPNIGDYSNEPGEDKMPLVTIFVEKKPRKKTKSSHTRMFFTPLKQENLFFFSLTWVWSNEKVFYLSLLCFLFSFIMIQFGAFNLILFYVLYFSSHPSVERIFSFLLSKFQFWCLSKQEKQTMRRGLIHRGCPHPHRACMRSSRSFWRINIMRITFPFAFFPATSPHNLI